MISDRIQRMGKNGKVEARTRAAHLQNTGKTIISLDVGEPDFGTPKPIVEAAIDALHEGFTHYTPAEGLLELREAVSKKLEEENGMAYPADQIIISAGAKQALAGALFSICNPGDEVLIPVPCWDSYPQMVRLAGGVPVWIPLSEDHGFLPPVDAIRAKITSRTRCLILNTPHNPTGRIYPEALLREIGELACDADFYIISDEIYEYIAYERRCVSVGSIHEKIRERTITVNGFSKSHAMTGWRIGYAAGPADVISAMKLFQSYTTSCPNSVAQRASLAALSEATEMAREMVLSFKERRDWMVRHLPMAGIRDFLSPEGAFYIWADVSSYFGSVWNGKLLADSDDVAGFLLEEAGVSVNGGSPFLSKTHIRISYSASMEDLKMALAHMGEALHKLNQMNR